MRIALLKAAFLVASGLGVLVLLVATSRTSAVAILAYMAIWAGIEGPIRLFLRLAALRRLKCPGCEMGFRVDAPGDALDLDPPTPAAPAVTLLTCGACHLSSAFDPTGRPVRPQEWGLEEWPG